MFLCMGLIVAESDSHAYYIRAQTYLGFPDGTSGGPAYTMDTGQISQASTSIQDYQSVTTSESTPLSSQGAALVNLTTGALGVYAQAIGNDFTQNSNAQASALLGETITFQNLSSNFDLTINVSVFGNTSSTGQYGSADGTFSLTANGAIDSGTISSGANALTGNYTDSVIVTVDANDPYLSITSQLQVSVANSRSSLVYGTATADYFNTAYLSLDNIPEGVTFTSESGVFLTQQVPPPCVGDFEPDGDVDGLDAATQAQGGTGVSTADFSKNFGRNDCPEK